MSGSSKTTNDEKDIATIGSLHKAITTPAGMCAYTDGSRETNFITTNECALSEAAKRTTARGDPIITVRSRIGFPLGPNKSHYVKNGTPRGVGVCSGQQPYTFAKVTRGARTLLTESEETARTDDPTQQAYGNSGGKLREAGWGLTEADLLALLRQQCAIDVVTTVCAHSREIKQTEVARLEVLYADAVSLAATRINATATDPEARKKPICLLETGQVKKDPAKQTHTTWEIVRGAYPEALGRPEIKAKKETKFGDEIMLGREWFGPEKETSSYGAKAPPGTSNSEHGKKVEKENSKTRTAMVETATSLAELLTWINGPFVEVRATAQACAGARTILLVSYPDNTVKVDLLKLKEIYDRIKYVRLVLDKLDAFLKPVASAAKPLGAKFTFEICWLGTKTTQEGSTYAGAQKAKGEEDKVENKMELTMQWKELKKDVGEHKKYQVGLDFGAEFTLPNMLGFTFSGEIPITALATKFGELVNDLKNAYERYVEGKKKPGGDVGAGLFFTFKIELSLGGSGKLHTDEYGEGEGTIKISGHAAFSIGLVLKFGVGKLAVECEASFDPEVEFVYSLRRIGYTMQIAYKLTLKVTVEIDCWGFKPGKTWGPYPVIDDKTNPSEHFALFGASE